MSVYNASINDSHKHQRWSALHNSQSLKAIKGIDAKLSMLDVYVNPGYISNISMGMY